MNNKHLEQIMEIKDSEWNKLFALIPQIEAKIDFGQWSDNGKSSGVSMAMPHYIPAPIVCDFVRMVYGIGLIINFDWMKWHHGQEILRDETTNFDNLEIVTLCKLITIIVRADRFSEGYLLRCFEDGCIIKLLKSLKWQVKNQLSDKL